MKVDFRNCEYADLEFILRLKELCIKWYIEIIYGWNTDVQREKTKSELDNHKDDMRIILDDSKPIGVTTFYKKDGTYIMGLIMIHPDYQGTGIGTKIINEYINIAKNDRSKIITKTYKENPALKLYKKLGFKRYDEDKTHIHLSMDFNEIK